MNRLRNQLAINRNRSLLVDEFEPRSRDESRLLDIARSIGEYDLRYLKSIYDRFGILIIEYAWTELRDAIAERRPIKNQCRFFTYLIEKLRPDKQQTLEGGENDVR